MSRKSKKYYTKVISQLTYCNGETAHQHLIAIVRDKDKQCLIINAHWRKNDAETEAELLAYFLNIEYKKTPNKSEEDSDET